MVCPPALDVVCGAGWVHPGGRSRWQERFRAAIKYTPHTVTGSPSLFGVLSADWMNQAVWGRGRALWDALLRCYSRFIKRKASI